jgi:Reverse transcriptase (RNA-dependent DNA polymerase)
MVGAGLLDESISTTTDLQAMKFDQAMMTPEKDEWMKAVEEEYLRMQKNKVWKPVSKSEIPNKAKILTSTWAMKRKANGTFRARINARGYEQVEGIHYTGNSIAAPVTNDTTIKIMLVLVALAGWEMQVIDVQGAFLIGRSNDKEDLYMKVLQGFEDKYDKNSVLKLNRTIYGLKQAASAFWSELLKALNKIGFERSGADHCLYFKWGEEGLCICLSWVDDCLIAGGMNEVRNVIDKFKRYLECDEGGEAKEYVGCQIIYPKSKRSTKLLRPVIIKSFEDEFGIKSGKFNIPAVQGSTLQAGEDDNTVGLAVLKRYRTAVGKLLYLAK